MAKTTKDGTGMLRTIGLFVAIAVLANACHADYANVVEADNPVAYWRLDDGIGTTADDAVGSVNGSLAGDATWVNGWVNKAVQFDGTGDYIVLGTSSTLKPTTAITIEALINPSVSSSTDQAIVGGGAFATYMLSFKNNKIWFWIGNTARTAWNFQIGSSVLSINTWSQVVATFDSTTGIAKIYINGLEDATVTKSAEAIGYSSTASVSIGRYVASTYEFNGIIDEVAIYDRAISSNEVLAHYNAIPEPSCMALLGSCIVVVFARRKR